MRQKKIDARDIRCRVANRLTRTVFQMVSGRKLFKHPAGLDRGYVIDKLLTFHREHKTPPAIITRDLKVAAELIPKGCRVDEAKPLRALVEKGQKSRRKGPQELGMLLIRLPCQNHLVLGLLRKEMVYKLLKTLLVPMVFMGA